MPTLEEVHAQSYGDMPFDEFVKRYHQKFYSDMPIEDFVRKAGGVSAKAPSPKSIAPGDWEGLASRLSTAEAQAREAGPVDPATASAVRQEAARKEGRLYGQQNAQSGVGLIGEGVGRAMDQFAAGVPRLAEAYMPGWLGGQSAVPGAEAHEFLKAADQGRADTNPGTAIAGNIVGGGAQALAMPVSSAPTLAARLGVSGLQGAALNAAGSAIESRGDVAHTAAGAGLGFVGGAAGQGVGEAAIKAGRALIDPLRGLAKSGPAEQQAAARVLLAARNAGIDDATAAAKLAELGPEGFLADILGKHGQSLARSSANLSPEARTILENASSGRIAGQQDRIVDALTGGNALPGATIKEAQKAAYEAAKPGVRAAYAKAADEGFATPIDWPDWIKNTPAVQEALRSAQAETKNRIAAFGENEGSQFAVLDAARQYLANKGFKEGDGTLKALANKMNEFIDNNVEAAGEARKLAKLYKEQQAALEAGGNLARTRPAPDAMRAAQASAHPQQVEQGYLINKVSEINQRAPGKRTVDLIDGTPMQRNALAAALQGRAADVTKQTAAERKFLEFERALSGNSTTARQLAELGLVTGAGAAGGYMTGFDPMQAGSIAGIAALSKRGYGKIAEALAKKNEAAVAPKVAEAILKQALPKLQDANGKQITETARRRLVEALIRDTSRAVGYRAGQ